MKFNNIMVDLETLGGAPDGAILSIGACRFNMEEVEPEERWFHMGLSAKLNLRAGRKIDGDTVEWWLSQSKAAQDMVLTVPRAPNFTSLIAEFDDWLRVEDIDFIWAKPPSFDIELLKHAYISAGLDWPFHWAVDRDLRTLLHFAKVRGNFAANNLPFAGEKHNAAHDAAHQARQVILAIK